MFAHRPGIRRHQKAPKCEKEGSNYRFWSHKTCSSLFSSVAMPVDVMPVAQSLPLDKVESWHQHPCPCDHVTRVLPTHHLAFTYQHEADLFESP